MHLRQIALLPILATLAACDSSTPTDPPGLTEGHIQGTWAFIGSSAAPCARDMTVRVKQLVRVKDSTVIGFMSGEWSLEDGSFSANFTGSGDLGTGSFKTVLLVTSPRIELVGNFRPDGTASASYSEPGCSQAMTGRRE